MVDGRQEIEQHAQEIGHQLTFIYTDPMVDGRQEKATLTIWLKFKLLSEAKTINRGERTSASFWQTFLLVSNPCRTLNLIKDSCYCFAIRL